MKINGKNLVFLLLVVFILFFQTSCRNKEKEEQAWEKYKNFSQLSKKYESNPEKFNSDLEAISKEMDDILPDIKDPEKRGEVLSLKAYSVGILGRETGVEELFDEATKMSPQNYLVYLRYGKYSYLQDKKTKALNFLENSLNYMPEHLIEPRIEALF
ncbi:MAG: tetratricopeptide repeat protein, partial [Vulcanimicrobiota bacterium]